MSLARAYGLLTSQGWVRRGFGGKLIGPTVHGELNGEFKVENTPYSIHYGFEFPEQSL